MSSVESRNTFRHFDFMDFGENLIIPVDNHGNNEYVYLDIKFKGENCLQKRKFCP